MPYLKTKATDLYERLGGGAEAEIFASSASSRPAPSPLQLLLDSSSHASIRHRVRLAAEAAFKLAYPYANLLWEAYLLLFNLRYLFGKSPHWRPWYRLLGIEVRRLGQEDYVRGSPGQYSSLCRDSREITPPAYRNGSTRYRRRCSNCSPLQPLRVRQPHDPRSDSSSRA